MELVSLEFKGLGAFFWEGSLGIISLPANGVQGTKARSEVLLGLNLQRVPCGQELCGLAPYPQGLSTIQSLVTA